MVINTVAFLGGGGGALAALGLPIYSPWGAVGAAAGDGAASGAAGDDQVVDAEVVDEPVDTEKK
ncbi:hypothetical protein [Nocardia carnea]|uniref:hypothetical protein n=1 Tax=Nocardia carnea TaxID=37328 RepID=UPI002455F05C|nr:hypothetical protein [Nocardia carnea]